jgi:flagellar basal-body rod protein FlgC
MFGSLDISTSALVANRIRLDIAAANTANQDALCNAQGQYEPYRARYPMLATGDPTSGSPMGVHVAEIGVRQGPLPLKYEPNSQFADANGYVAYPNVDIVRE